MYLPANTTALVQPMDQGVLESFKRRYRKSLLQRLLLEDEENRSIIDFVKLINIMDVVYMVAAAWDDLPSLTLAKSWRKLLSIESAQESEESVPLHTDEQCEDLAIQLDGNIQSEDVIEWMHGDSDDPGYQLLSDDDFVQLVTNPNQIVEDESDEDESEEYQNIPSSGEVKNMLDQCLLWYERQEEREHSNFSTPDEMCSEI